MKKFFFAILLIFLILMVIFIKFEKKFELVAVINMEDNIDISGYDNSIFFYDKKDIVESFLNSSDIKDVSFNKYKLISVFNTLEYENDYYLLCWGKQLKSIKYRLFDYNSKRGMYENSREYYTPDKKHIYIYKLKKSTVLYYYPNG